MEAIVISYKTSYEGFLSKRIKRIIKIPEKYGRRRSCSGIQCDDCLLKQPNCSAVLGYPTDIKVEIKDIKK